MQTKAQSTSHPQPIRSGTMLPAPPSGRSVPRATPLRRLIAAFLWLCRLLLVRPVGRRAREAKLAALPERTLRDIGLKRTDALAAAHGMVPLEALVQRYPSAGPLYVCGRPGFRPTLVRLSKAA